MNIKKYSFRWSDVDANMHIRNTAYNDIFIQCRLDLLSDIGFGMKEFKAHGMGPMIIHEHLFYVKEVRADSEVYVDMQLRGHSESGKYTQLAQHLYNNKGELSCYLDLSIVWLDVKERKLAIPPKVLTDGLMRLEKTPDYKIIDSSSLKASHVPYGKKIDVNSL